MILAASLLLSENPFSFVSESLRACILAEIKRRGFQNYISLYRNYLRLRAMGKLRSSIAENRKEGFCMNGS
jgi:hypothetical protein